MLYREFQFEINKHNQLKDRIDKKSVNAMFVGEQVLLKKLTRILVRA
ncbi:MAG: hypothetical protein ACJA1S_001599 [Cellvibrionaceae bacterium]